LLSRFDLLFVLVDRPDRRNDEALARHITYVHQHKKSPQDENQEGTISSDVLRAFITRARTFSPVVPSNLTETIVSEYVQMRQFSLGEGDRYDSRKLIGTPRVLLSILRVAQALARLRFSNEVSAPDVKEAIRLMKEAKNSTLPLDETMIPEDQDVTSRVYRAIRKLLRGTEEIGLADLKQSLVGQGHTMDQIDHTLETYAVQDIWTISNEVLSLNV